MKSHLALFQSHRAGAKRRGISFDLTFEQWLAIWGEKIAMRGRGKNLLSMCRIRDEGGYSVGNVYLGTPKQNQHDRSVALKVRRAQVKSAKSAPSDHSYISDAWTDRSKVFDEYTEDEECEESC